MKPIQKLVVITLLLIILGISFNQFTNTSALPAGSMTQEAAQTLQNHDKARAEFNRTHKHVRFS